MSFRVWRIVLTLLLLLAADVIARSEPRVPVIWDDRALADWATPIAAIKTRPAHYTATEYYRVPADNVRTYPVYRPDNEPPGYWEWLNKQKPEPLVDLAKIGSRKDWIAAGERAFREIDSPLTRTDDPAVIALARSPATFAAVICFSRENRCPR